MFCGGIERFFRNTMTLFAKFAGATRFKWLLLTFFAVAAVSSCGFDDDDAEPPTYPIELLGVWQGVGAEITVADPEGTEGEKRTESLENIRVAINPNGTFVTSECDETGKWREKDRSFWSYKDGSLLVFDGSMVIADCKVTTLDTYNLILKSVEEVSAPDVPDGSAGEEGESDADAGLPEGSTVTTVSSFIRLMMAE